LPRDWKALTVLGKFVLRIVFGALATLGLLASAPAQATTAGARRAKIDAIIVHAISGPSCAGGRVVFSGAPGDAAKWKTFFDRHPFLGIHYVVGRDGTVLPSTPEERMANHALDNNATTIGIELVHEGDGRETFGEAQVTALIKLVKGIQQRHGIAIERIKGHGDVDNRTFQCAGATHKGRSDPGPNFPWIRMLTALAIQDAAPSMAPVAGAPQPPRLLVAPQLVTSPPAPRPVESPYRLNGPNPARR
jgi:N-acetylmuramoyl-L-alanine amidase